MSNLEDVIPLLRPSPRSFVLLAMITSLSTIVLHVILQHGSSYWSKTMEAIPWKPRIKDADVGIVRARHEAPGGQHTDGTLQEV